MIETIITKKFHFEIILCLLVPKINHPGIRILKLQSALATESTGKTYSLLPSFNNSETPYFTQTQNINIQPEIFLILKILSPHSPPNKTLWKACLPLISLLLLTWAEAASLQCYPIKPLCVVKCSMGHCGISWLLTARRPFTSELFTYSLGWIYPWVLQEFHWQ